jgi:hypothetical protein
MIKTFLIVFMIKFTSCFMMGKPEAEGGVRDMPQMWLD